MDSTPSGAGGDSYWQLTAASAINTEQLSVQAVWELLLRDMWIVYTDSWSDVNIIFMLIKVRDEKEAGEESLFSKVDRLLDKWMSVRVGALFTTSEVSVLVYKSFSELVGVGKWTC
jgi:hypothetical protein